MSIKKYEDFQLNENDDNYSGIMANHFRGDDDFGSTDPEVIKNNERKENAKTITHLHGQERNPYEIYWDDLEEDMKRDFGEFTDIRSVDAIWVMEWLKSKITDKKITL